MGFLRFIRYSYSPVEWQGIRYKTGQNNCRPVFCYHPKEVGITLAVATATVPVALPGSINPRTGPKQPNCRKSEEKR